MLRVSYFYHKRKSMRPTCVWIVITEPNGYRLKFGPEENKALRFDSATPLPKNWTAV